MADDDYCLSARHQAQRFLTDWAGANPVVKEFERAFCREAAKRRIPVHAQLVDGDCVSIVHSQYGMLLESTDWSVLGRIGFLAMPAVRPSRLEWGGYCKSKLRDWTYQPDVWYVTNAPPF